MVMNEKLKILAHKIVENIDKKVKKSNVSDFHKFRKNIGIGADGTPTKYIDKIAEDVAIDIIKKSKIKVNLLSEEAGFLDFNGEYTFVLDPIDGTRNASRGIPFYSVSLGIGKLKLNDIEYGIVKNIPTGDIFIAEKKVGAFFNKKLMRLPEMPEKLFLSSLTLGKNYDNLTIKLAKQNNVRSLGSASLEMCMVAIGAIDLYVVGKEFLRVTDIAASTLIVREAGGVVTNTLGKELDASLDLDNRVSVVAACNIDIIRQILS